MINKTMQAIRDWLGFKKATKEDTEPKYIIPEMPKELHDKAVNFLSMIISEAIKESIRMKMEDDPVTWYAPHHFGWGMYIRNLLRQNVCLDDQLPTGNWDDYYVQCVEDAVKFKE